MEDIIAYALTALGRLALGGYFVASGIRQFLMRDTIAPSLAERGVPNAGATVLGAAGLQVVAGLLLALGLMVILPGLLLFAFTVTVTVTLLNFWDIEPGEDRTAALNGFQQNAAVAGGLLLAVAGVL